MAKLIYEATLLVCSSCVIFTGTVSAVLLMLVWPNDRILGLSTRLVIGLCVIIVTIFSVGFVGTIAESTNALIIYACLLILFPISVLLVEIILRLSSLSPVPVPANNEIQHARPPPPLAESGPNGRNTTTSQQQHNNDANSNTARTLSTPTLTSTMIYSNSFTSDSFLLRNKNNKVQGNLNLTKNSISSPSLDVFGDIGGRINASAKPSLHLNALLLPSSSPSNESNGFNLSNHMLLLSDKKFSFGSLSGDIASASQQLPTDQYHRPVQDEYQPAPSSSAKHLSSEQHQQNSAIDSLIELRFNDNLAKLNGQKIKNKSSKLNDNNNNNNKRIDPADGENIFQKIFTESLNSKVEYSIEYILIGMLAFVLLQIVISYLLAFEIRSMRAQLKILAASAQSMPLSLSSSTSPSSTPVNLPSSNSFDNDAKNFYQLNPESVCLSVVGPTNEDNSGATAIVLTTDETCLDAINLYTVDQVYNCYNEHYLHKPQQKPKTNQQLEQQPNQMNINVHNVLLSEHSFDKRPLVQVHVNPEQPGTNELNEVNNKKNGTVILNYGKNIYENCHNNKQLQRHPYQLHNSYYVHPTLEQKSTYYECHQQRNHSNENNFKNVRFDNEMITSNNLSKTKATLNKKEDIYEKGNKTSNRRKDRAGSFRVTFESLPEFIESNENDYAENDEKTNSTNSSENRNKESREVTEMTTVESNGENSHSKTLLLSTANEQKQQQIDQPNH